MAEEKDIKIISGKICVSSKALRETLGINEESTLVRWGQRGCPKVSRGWWSIKDVLDWRAATPKTKDDPDLSAAEKKTIIESELKEQQLATAVRKNEIESGEYIAKIEVVSVLQRFCTTLKRSMKGYSRKITADLAHTVTTEQARRIENMVKETTDDALRQISINGVYDGKKSSTNDS